MSRILIVDTAGTGRDALRAALAVAAGETEVVGVGDADAIAAELDRARFDGVLLAAAVPGVELASLEARLRAGATEGDGPPAWLVLVTETAVEPRPPEADAVLALADLTPTLLAYTVRHAAAFAEMRRDLSWNAAERERRTLTDRVSGLGNRVLFGWELDRQIGIAARNAAGFVLLMINVDRLGDLNNRYGRDMGDRVLQEIGRRLTGMLRGADMAFRLEKDTFAALVTTGVNSYGVETVARRVIREIAVPVNLGEEAVPVSVSVGIGFFPEHGASADVLVQRVEAAMRRAGDSESGFVVAEDA